MIRIFCKEDKADKARASITVEAALVLPIFIFAILAFLYLLQIIYVQENIQAGLTELSKEASRYGFVYEDLTRMEDSDVKNSSVRETEVGESQQNNGKDSELLQSMTKSTYFKMKLINYLKQKGSKYPCVEGGLYGITMINSSFMEEDDYIDLVAVYRVKIPVLFISVNNFTMVQRVRTRAFVGLDKTDPDKLNPGSDSDSENQIVYITETGTKYHFNRDCSHIQLTIRGVSNGELETLRNSGGGKYKPCEICCQNAKFNSNTLIYIAENGDRYHSTLDCSGLKRTVIAIPISEAGSRTPCSRCGK